MKKRRNIKANKLVQRINSNLELLNSENKIVDSPEKAQMVPLRDMVRKLYKEGILTRMELASIFNVSHGSIYSYTKDIKGIKRKEKTILHPTLNKVIPITDYIKELKEQQKWDLRKIAKHLTMLTGRYWDYHQVWYKLKKSDK